MDPRRAWHYVYDRNTDEFFSNMPEMSSCRIEGYPPFTFLACMSNSLTRQHGLFYVGLEWRRERKEVMVMVVTERGKGEVE